MKMRKFVSGLLSVLLCFTLATAVVGAAGRDVSFEETLAADLKSLGLFRGVTETEFDLGRAPTRAEALTMLVRMLGKEAEAQQGEWSHPFTDLVSWQEPYVGYAYENKLTNGVTATQSGSDSSASAAMYLTFVLRALGYSDTNGADFTWDDPFSLARQVGILPEGVDTGSFWRADVVLVSYAAMEARLKGSAQTLADKLITAGAFTRAQYDACYDGDALDNRPAEEPTPSGPLTALQISEKCADAVFYIDIYGFNGALAGRGSGFFISSDGLAITNFHVAANSGALVLTTTDGKQYSDVKIVDYDAENDLALLRVSGGPFPYLELGDSSALRQGQQVYAIGSPRGLQNTMSQGIVSSVSRTINGTNYVQISVPIDHGSSGGALLDEYGRVVGVTTAGFEGGGDLNLAIPSQRIRGLDTSSTTGYVMWQDKVYPGLSKACDFGAFSGVREVDFAYTQLGVLYMYDVWDFHDLLGVEDAEQFGRTMYYYGEALKLNGFTQVEGTVGDSVLYESDTEMVYVVVDYENAAIYVLAEVLPVYYAERPALPDLGWYLGLEPYDAGPVENSQVYLYRWAQYYTAAEINSALSGYFELLEEEGFTYVYSENGVYLFEGHGLSVGVMLDNRVVAVDIAYL